MNFVKTIFSHALTTLVLGFVLGFVANDYASFRESKRDSLKTEFNQSRNTAAQIDKQLKLLSLVATGKSAQKPEIVSDLGNSILELYDEVTLVAKRVPAATEPVKNYGAALVTLKGAAEKLTGPIDGQEFVEAVSNFYVQKEKYERVVTDAQGSFLR